MSYVVESPENQQLTFTDMGSGKAHIFYVSERFELFSRYFQQLLLMNKPSATFYSMINPKIKMTDLSGSKTKKLVIETWLIQKVIKEKPFIGQVTYFIDFGSFFKRLSEYFEVIFCDESWKYNVADLKIESVFQQNDFQFLFQVFGPNRESLVVRVIKRFNEIAPNRLNLRDIFGGYLNLSGAFLKIMTVVAHPAFWIIVFENCEYGSLFDLIYRYQSQKHTLSEGSLCLIVRQLLEGINEVHKMGKVLMSIKPENILICALNKVVISRFSKGQLFQKSKLKEGRLLENTEYMAPEMFEKDLLESDPEKIIDTKIMRVGKGVDFWSLGILM